MNKLPRWRFNLGRAPARDGPLPRVIHRDRSSGIRIQFKVARCRVESDRSKPRPRHV